MKSQYRHRYCTWACNGRCVSVITVRLGLQAVEAEFTDILDPAMCAASSWVANASPMDTMRMHNLETVESSIAKDNISGSAADAVSTGMSSKPVSVRHYLLNWSLCQL